MCMLAFVEVLCGLKVTSLGGTKRFLSDSGVSSLSTAVFSWNCGPLTHHYQYVFHDQPHMSATAQQLTSSQHWIISFLPVRRNYKHVHRAQIPARSDSGISLFSLTSSLSNSHTHSEHISSTVIVYIDLALSLMAWITPHHRHGRLSHWGGPLHRREVAPGLCGHAASSDLRTCEPKQEISVSVTCHPLFSLAIKF